MKYIEPWKIVVGRLQKMEKDEVAEMFARDMDISVGIAISLYDAGYRNIDDIRNADIIDLTLVKGIGPALAAKIKKQVASERAYGSKTSLATESTSKNKSRKTGDEDDDNSATIFVGKPKRSKKSEEETTLGSKRTNAVKNGRTRKKDFKLGFVLPKMNEKDRKMMWSVLFAFTIIWLIFVSISLSSTWAGIEFVGNKGVTKTVMEFTLTRYDVTITSELSKGTPQYYSDSIANLPTSDNVKQVFFTTNDYARTLWTMSIISFVMVGFMWVRIFLWDPLEIIEDRIKSYRTRFMKRLPFINIANVTKVILAVTIILLIATPIYFATAIQDAAKKDYGVGGASLEGGVSVQLSNNIKVDVGSYSLLWDRMIGLYVLIFAFLLTVSVIIILSRQYLKTLAKQLLVALK